MTKNSLTKLKSVCQFTPSWTFRIRDSRKIRSLQIGLVGLGIDDPRRDWVGVGAEQLDLQRPGDRPRDSVLHCEDIFHLRSYILPTKAESHRPPW